jgi:hypothetical protein
MLSPDREGSQYATQTTDRRPAGSSAAVDPAGRGSSVFDGSVRCSRARIPTVARSAAKLGQGGLFDDTPAEVNPGVCGQ